MKKIVNISQTFVTYHGCGNDFYDGTRKILQKNRNYIRPTYYPSWKKPVDVLNKVETKGQLKSKPRVTSDYIKRYMHYINVFSNSKDYFSSDENLTSDDESITSDASNTKQNLSTEDETLNLNTSTTGEDLIIDEDTAHKDNKNDRQIPDNKNEINN